MEEDKNLTPEPAALTDAPAEDNNQEQTELNSDTPSVDGVGTEKPAEDDKDVNPGDDSAEDKDAEGTPEPASEVPEGGDENTDASGNPKPE